MFFPADAPSHKKVGFHPRILGTPTPMFPGYEIDISDRVSDSDKPDAVWHRDRAKNMIRNHPEIKDLFGNTPSTAFWCIAFASAQIALAVGLSAVRVTGGRVLSACIRFFRFSCPGETLKVESHF